MDCEVFRKRLSTYLSGQMAAAEAAQVELHFASCRECGAFLEQTRGEVFSTDQEFVAGVLARTSGSVCSACREYLCLISDGAVDALHVRLLESHLENCPDCRRVADLLNQLADVLPTLAEEDPGPAFAASVLAACRTVSPRPRVERRQRLWSWLWRPLFPLEAAYVGTLVFVLGFTAVLGSPSASTLSRLGSAVKPAVGWVEQVEPYWSRWAEEAATQVTELRRWSEELADRCGKETARIAEDLGERIRRTAEKF
ncbi:MAG: hypothetical protein Kow001_06010 [Acidobacteriota bacterium]